MTAGQVVLDDRSFWVLVGVVALTSIVALVASFAAWRAARSARTAIDQLEAARREVVVPAREWQERSPIPRRAADGAVAGTVVPEPSLAVPIPPPPPTPPVSPPPATPGDAASMPPIGPDRPRPASPPSARPTTAPPRRSDMLEDPDRPGRPVDVDLLPAPSSAYLTDPPRTEPLSRPRGVTSTPASGGGEREVRPGVFVSTPGRPAAVPPTEADAAPSSDAAAEDGEPGGTAGSEMVSDPTGSSEPPASSAIAVESDTGSSPEPEPEP